MASSNEYAPSSGEGSDSESPPQPVRIIPRGTQRTPVPVAPLTPAPVPIYIDGILHSEDDLPRTEDQDKPSPVWVASVFNADDREAIRRDRPLAVYRSANDFRITLGNSQNGVQSTSTEDERRPTWKGPIFGMYLSATAHFPLQEESYDSEPEISVKRYVAKNFESLVFENATQSEIKIFSPFLCSGLKIIAGYYPAFNSRRLPHPYYIIKTFPEGIGPRPLSFPYPWTFLLHRFPEIEAFVQESRLPSTHLASEDDRSADVLDLEKEHMQVLYDFLKPHYEKNVLPYSKQLQQPSSECLFPFDKLCFAFKPGMDVYVQIGDSIQAMVVLGIRSNLDAISDREAEIMRELRCWILDLWFLASDGENIGRQFTSYSIYSFEGLKQLTNLKACPVSVWDARDGGARRKRLTQRGRLLFKSLKQGHLLADYRGPINGGVKHYSGNIIIDIRRGITLTKYGKPSFATIYDQNCIGIFQDYDNIYVYEGKNAVSDSWMPPSDYEDGTRALLSFNAPVWHIPARPARPPPPPTHLPGHKPYGTPSMSYHRTDSRPSHRHPPIVHNDNEERHNEPDVYSGGLVLRVGHYITSPSEKKERSLRDSLTDHQYLLLCPGTLAFALKTKQWMTIQPDYATEVEQSNESLLNLVLEPSELSTIKALATRQNSKRDIWAADFIEGKGTGKIILLHGPPGVGKTYTVEAIAQYLHRPLLALTVADIGTLETRVEQELLKWFSLAEAWDAVLLVDEADIFLERRQNRDLARNGLVSAFLRRMEYFKGLLFLTTNRVGHIDDAFISRVHVAIGYESLSPAGRSEIWKGFFRKLNKERAGKIQIAQGAKKWVLDKALSGTAQLNGRDIRNALQTAITLAEAEYEEDPEFDPDTTTIVVDQTHFERVLGITNKFQAYVESIRREDEKKRAAGRHDRNDYWKVEQNTGGSS